MVYTVYSLFEGINVHILFLGKGYTVFLCPAIHNLFIAGTVNVALILYCFLTSLVYNRLLLRSQSIINILIDAEEQTVINCIPHRAVWLNLLHTGCINCRKGILLALNCVLLKSGIGFRPVQVSSICSPSLIAFHKKVGACHTDFQVLHIVHGFYLAHAVGKLTEAVLCNSHAVQTILTEDFL